MNFQRPDKYLLVDITIHPHEDIKETSNIVKLYSTWFGGYLNGDEWRLNSSITKVEKEIKKDENKNEYPIFKIYGNSNTIYEVGLNIGSTSWSYQNLLNMLKNKPSYVEIKIIEDTNEVINRLENFIN